MKLLTIIFAFYLLLLPFYICIDVDNCNKIAKTETVNDLVNHQKHQEEKKSCNPFCNCACCTQLVVNHFHYNKIMLDKPIEIPKQLYYFNTNSRSSAYLGNIWQPPKNLCLV